MSKDIQTGLFPVSYRIALGSVERPILGGASLTLKLLVDTVNKQVSGVGHITQPVSPPLNLVSQFTGEWSYICTMKECHILVVAEGFDLSPLLVGGHPIEHKNAKLRMVMNEDWQCGVANFSFFARGQWHEVEGARAELSTIDAQQSRKQLEESAAEKKPVLED
ncbi:DUF1842 domain-containing protein [Ferrimonas sediminicola]|uniref:DUF1842 domain-containing protein n=1 Tax=Ferrimonas sediminicola TaxID=2569538 RepID=A0A4V5NVS4_9GAMM|nr:DUF1842 domain-containing protein [Ferrimonas sediminicola]